MKEQMIQGLGILHPEMILTGAALVLLLLAKRVRGTRAALGVTIAAALAAGYSAWGGASAETVSGFSGMIVQDGYSQFFEVLIAAALILGALLSAKSEPDEESTPSEYFVLLLLAATGMMLAVSATDLMTLYLGLELTTLCSYILVGLRIENPTANEAAIKYFLMGSFASALLLFGISLTYGMTSTTSYAGISAALMGQSSDPLLLMAVGLVAAGLAFKVSAVPFHSWAPDAYQGAPSPVAAFMASGPKAAGLAVIGRISIQAFESQDEMMSLILISIAALSIVVGSVLALSQTNMKRLLAYSSIAHAGYALMGLSGGTAAGAESTMTYAFFYVFMTIGAFGMIVALGERGERLDGYRGLATQRPGMAAVMLLFLLALTGIPLTAGFTAKFVVILSAVKAGEVSLAILAVLCSVISAFIYMRVAVLMYMSDPEEEVAPAAPGGMVKAALAVAALVTLVGGVLPGVLTDWAVFT